MMGDPRLGGPRPPFRVPSSPGNLDPKPDHGEHSYVGSSCLDGYNSIVVGGDSGIGRAVAIAFAREGANVLIAYRADNEGAEETARWVRDAGGRALLIAGDVSSESYRRVLVDQAMERFGSIDVIVSDAPSIGDRRFATDDNLSAASIEQAIRTDQEAIFTLTKVASESMRPGAAIIATALARSEYSPALQRAYAAYRGGIANLTGSLAHGLAARGVRVNAVEPGPVWAPRMLAVLTDPQLTHFGANTLLGRPAQ